MFASPHSARSQPAPDDKPTLEIYGFGQADAIVDVKQNNPDWYDVNRPSRLPSSAGEFGKDGHVYPSGRQSRFGAPKARCRRQTATLEFDIFGVGARQTNSQFMDVDHYRAAFG
jgi:hypothetical protein